MKTPVYQQAIITKIEESRLYLSMYHDTDWDDFREPNADAEPEKTMDLILEDDDLGRQVGDRVVLEFKKYNSYLTIFLLYLVPFMLFGVLKFGFEELGLSNAISACLSLGIAFVYFITIQLFKHKLKAELVIKIK